MAVKTERECLLLQLQWFCITAKLCGNGAVGPNNVPRTHISHHRIPCQRAHIQSTNVTVSKWNAVHVWLPSARYCQLHALLCHSNLYLGWFSFRRQDSALKYCFILSLYFIYCFFFAEVVAACCRVWLKCTAALNVKSSMIGYSACLHLPFVLYSVKLQCRDSFRSSASSYIDCIRAF